MLDEYKKIAAQLVSLKSVSVGSEFKDDVAQTARFLRNLLESYGFNVQVYEGYGYPVILASYEVEDSAKHALIYGHYDVQPAAKEDGWDTDPFQLVEKEGKLYGRGIMDDKCQVLIHILAIGKLIQKKKLRYNVKFLLEGNEEVGSPFIEQFVKDHYQELSCDFVLISDGELTLGAPTIELSNRGILNLTLSIQTADGDLHSGIYGGSAPNALHELSRIVNTFYDKNNKIAIDGIYKDVDPIEKTVAIPFDLEEYKRNTGTKTLKTEPQYDYYTQVGLRPAITVTGMYGGYLGEGHKTVIPSKATAKINVRLVKSQTPEKVAQLFTKHFKKVIPDYVTYSVSYDEFVKPVKTDIDNPYVKSAKKVLKEVFKDKIRYKFVGGTEPIVLYFQEILHKPVVSVPFANEDGHMHGQNENFDIKNIEKGFEFSEKFFGE